MPVVVEKTHGGQMKKLMDFLFGKKYPIFNKEGGIEHSQKDRFRQWRENYKINPNKNWRNHKGMTFKDKKSSN